MKRTLLIAGVALALVATSSASAQQDVTAPVLLDFTISPVGFGLLAGMGAE